MRGLNPLKAYILRLHPKRQLPSRIIMTLAPRPRYLHDRHLEVR
jgi:hypothetical protein